MEARNVHGECVGPSELDAVWVISPQRESFRRSSHYCQLQFTWLTSALHTSNFGTAWWGNSLFSVTAKQVFDGQNAVFIITRTRPFTECESEEKLLWAAILYSVYLSYFSYSVPVNFPDAKLNNTDSTTELPFLFLSSIMNKAFILCCVWHPVNHYRLFQNSVLGCRIWECAKFCHCFPYTSSFPGAYGQRKSLPNLVSVTNIVSQLTWIRLSV